MAVRVFFSFFFYRPSVNTFPPKWTDPISITIGGGISACITSRDTSFVVCCNLLCGRRMQVLRRWMESELLEKEEENRQRYNRLLLHTRKEPTTPGGAGGQERDNRPRPWLHLGRWLGLFLFFFLLKKTKGKAASSTLAPASHHFLLWRPPCVFLCVQSLCFSLLYFFSFFFFLPTHRPSIPPTQKTASAPTTFPREKKNGNKYSSSIEQSWHTRREKQPVIGFDLFLNAGQVSTSSSSKPLARFPFYLASNSLRRERGK